MLKIIFITGEAGLIGSALIRLLIAESDWVVVNIDNLIYAGKVGQGTGNRGNLRDRPQ